MCMEVLINKNDLCCPISHLIFLNPVLASDGHFYEKDCIEKWFVTSNISPLTNKLINNVVIESFFMVGLVNTFLNKHPEEKTNQYFRSNDHSTNLSEVKNFIKKKQFNKLLSYKKFQLEYLFDRMSNILKAPDNILKYIIDNSVDLEVKDEDGWRLIHYICDCSTPTIIKYLIDKGVDLEAETNDKVRPIHCICSNSASTLEILKYIINKGVDLEAETDDEYRPMHYICTNSSFETIKYAINYVINIKLKLTLDLYDCIQDNENLTSDEKIYLCGMRLN